MKLILLLFFLFTYYNISQVFNQREKQIDSLKVELKSADNKEKVEIYWMLSKLNFLHDTDLGLNYAKKSLSIAKDVGDVLGIAKAYEVLGVNYSVKAEFDSCEINLKKALELFTTLEELKKVGHVYIVLGINQVNQNKYNEAIEYLDLAINHFKENGIEDGLASAYVNYGNALMGSTKYEEAISKYFDAVKQFRKDGQPERVIEPYVNIGNAFFHLKDYDNAIKYYNITLEHSDTNDLSQHKSILLNNLGEVYTAKKKYNKANKYFKEALKMNRKIGNKRFISMNLSNIGNSLMHQGNFTEAKIYNDEAITVANEINSNDLLTLAYLNNGILNKLYYESELSKGKENQNLLKQSLDFLLKAEEYASKIQDIRKKIEIYNTIAEVLNLKNDNKAAYEYLKKYIYLEDSLNNEQSKAKVLALESTKENELKSQEIDFLKKENKYKSQLNYLLIIISILVIVLLYFVYNRYKINNLRNKELELIVAERTKELEVANEKIKESLKFEKNISDLKTNIILNTSHQFRTPLTAISSYIEILKLKVNSNEDLLNLVEKTQRSIHDLVSLINNVEQYHKSHIEGLELNITNCKIIDIVNDSITKIKYKNKSNHTFEVINNIKDSKINTDSNLISEAITNILDNAVKFSNEDSKIIVHLNEIDNRFEIDIEDSGSGIDEDEVSQIFEPLFVGKKHVGIKKGNGLGLTIAKTNIEKLGAQLKIDSIKDNGTKVKIII